MPIAGSQSHVEQLKPLWGSQIPYRYLITLEGYFFMYKNLYKFSLQP
jgi:hypothetical protein